jgi:hypothetical protein
VLKNGASGRDPALRGYCKCSHISNYAALSKTPRALADGPILVFRHPVVGVCLFRERLLQVGNAGGIDTSFKSFLCASTIKVLLNLIK